MRFAKHRNKKIEEQQGAARGSNRGATSSAPASSVGRNAPRGVANVSPEPRDEDDLNVGDWSARPNHKGLVPLVLGAVLIIAALGLVAYNLIDDYRAGREASAAAAQLSQSIEQQSNESAPIIDPDASMPVREVDGHEFIGLLEIPDLGLALPVQNAWSEQAARFSPCRYEGTVYAGNMIIAGHNYRTHFRHLKDLEMGAEVRFTDVTGHVYEYRVTGLETIDGYDVEGMRSGDWDLTLFTCTWNSVSRVTVRCTLVGA